MTDEVFNIWKANGKGSLYNLYVDNVFCSFQQLMEKFSVPKSHVFRYLQLRNFIGSNSGCFPLCPSRSLVDELMDYRTDTKKVLSKIYTLLSSHHETSLDELKQKWENDLNENISNSVWQKAIQNIHSSSVSLRHAVVQFKVVHRLHWSKDKLSKIKPDLDSSCDRCKHTPATLLHAFWTCPRLCDYWQSILKAFSSICKKAVHPCPLTTLFGVVSPDTPLDKHQRSMIAFCSLLARRLILFKWKDSRPPTIGHWIKEVMSHIHLEKIRYTLKGSIGKFYDQWLPFISYFENVSADKLT